jgi:hypothetical protein
MEVVRARCLPGEQAGMPFIKVREEVVAAVRDRSGEVGAVLELEGQQRSRVVSSNQFKVCDPETVSRAQG